MKLLETIRFENGEFDNLVYHQQRMNRSRRELFNCEDEIDLQHILQAGTLEAEQPIQASTPALQSGMFVKPPLFQASSLEKSTTIHSRSEIFKCRIIYSKQIEKIEFIPYQLPKIQSLKILVDDQIEYNHKYLDRDQLDHLYRQRGDCDDILIAKNGLITDTLFANTVFYNGVDWLTPAKPLLKGTQRASILEKGIIKTADIRVEVLKSFEKVRLINAMIRFEDEFEMEVESLVLT